MAIELNQMHVQSVQLTTNWSLAYHFCINTVIQIFTKCPFLNIDLTVHQSCLKFRVFCVFLVCAPWCIGLLCVCKCFLRLKEQFWSCVFLAENHKIQNSRHFMEQNVKKIIFVFSSYFFKLILTNIQWNWLF